MTFWKTLMAVSAAALLASPALADGSPMPEPIPEPEPVPEPEPMPEPEPAPAPEEYNYYLEIFGGVSFNPDLEYGGVLEEFDTGYNLGGAIGSSLTSAIDVEGEVFYTQSDYSNFVSNLSALSMMANIYFNMGLGSTDLYAGGGIGGVRVRYDGEHVFPEDTGLEWKFGWQLIGGIKTPFIGSSEIFGEYRFHDVMGDADIECCNVEYQSHNVSFGLRFLF